MRSTPFQFHAIGDWLPGRVNCRWIACSFKPSPQTQSLIEQAWAEASARPGIKLFDGPMCRLESFDATPDSLDLAISPVTYKAFMGTNLRNPQLGRSALANPLGISCALISSDDLLLMGQRNDRVAYYPGQVHPFAGAVEPADPLDVFCQLQRELHEELGLEPDDLAGLRCLGLAEDTSIHQPELIVMARARFTSDQLLARVDAEEHQSALAVPLRPAELQNLIEHPKTTPIGSATALLAGRAILGQQWFEHYTSAMA